MAVWSKTTTTDIYNVSRVDAEYYRPEYVNAERLIESMPHDKLSSYGRFIPGPFGSAFQVKNYDFKSTYRYIRGRDVKPFILQEDQNVYVPDSAYHRLVKYSVELNDLMISVVGTLGNASIVTSNEVPAIFSCKSTIFRTAKVNPYYLLAFLNSKYGRLCLLRRQRGAVQTGLNIEDLKSLPIPIFTLKERTSIASKVERAITLFRKSNNLYAQAQQILDSELKIDNMEFFEPIGYSTSYSEVVNNSRADADYYQPRFEILETHLKKLETRSLSAIATFIKGIEVGSDAYTTEGILFIRVSNVKISGIETGASDKNISNTLYSKLMVFKPEFNEFLLTKDGTPGVCYFVDESVDGIISGGIVKLRLTDTAIPYEYLALVINSMVCQMQIERACSGALILHWKPRDISKLLIPILSDDKMAQLADLVTQSKRAKRDSEKLLNQAKSQVEELIERVEKS